MLKTRKVTVRGIIYDNGKLFGQKLNRQGHVNDFYCAPGGGLEPGEDIVAGLRREMIEETGVTPDIGRLLFVVQFENDVKEFIEFFFHIKNASDYRAVDLTKTTHGVSEVAECGFVDLSEEAYFPEFLAGFDIESHVRTAQPVYLYNETQRPN